MTQANMSAGVRALVVLSSVVVVGCGASSRTLGQGDSGGALGDDNGGAPSRTSGNAATGATTSDDAGSAATSLDPCDSSSDYLRCNGKQVESCECTKQGPPVGMDLTGGPIYACDAYSWVKGAVCDVACDTTVNPSTGCIASETPVPECADDGMTCWNGNLTWCTDGYPSSTTPCADGTECTFVQGCQALCLASSATLDPRCPATPGVDTTDFCADDTAYHCACGYLIGSEPCGAPPDDCHLVPLEDSFNHASGQTSTCALPP
jgi:hypothetical protein